LFALQTNLETLDKIRATPRGCSVTLGTVSWHSFSDLEWKPIFEYRSTQKSEHVENQSMAHFNPLPPNGRVLIYL